MKSASESSWYLRHKRALAIAAAAVLSVFALGLAANLVYPVSAPSWQEPGENYSHVDSLASAHLAYSLSTKAVLGPLEWRTDQDSCYASVLVTPRVNKRFYINFIYYDRDEIPLYIRLWSAENPLPGKLITAESWWRGHTCEDVKEVKAHLLE